VLDKIYDLKSTPNLTLEDVKLGTSAQELLSSKSQLSEIAKEFNDNEIAVLGNRAITQITKFLDADKAKEDQLIQEQKLIDTKEKQIPTDAEEHKKADERK
jgi:hypothetical protein